MHSTPLPTCATMSEIHIDNVLSYSESLSSKKRIFSFSDIGEPREPKDELPVPGEVRVFSNFILDPRGRDQGRASEPIMASRAALIRMGNHTMIERPVHLRPHPCKEIIRTIHSAYIKTDAELRKCGIAFLKAQRAFYFGVSHKSEAKGNTYAVSCREAIF